MLLHILPDDTIDRRMTLSLCPIGVDRSPVVEARDETQ